MISAGKGQGTEIGLKNNQTAMSQLLEQKLCLGANTQIHWSFASNSVALY